MIYLLLRVAQHKHDPLNVRIIDHYKRIEIVLPPLSEGNTIRSQPQDIIEWNGLRCIAKGMPNKGAYLAFMQGTKRLVKNIKTIKLVFQNKGIVYA